MQPIGILGTILYLAHGDRRPGWLRVAVIGMTLTLLAGIGLLFT